MKMFNCVVFSLSAAVLVFASGLAEAAFVVTPAGYSSTGNLGALTSWDQNDLLTDTYSYFNSPSNPKGQAIKDELHLPFVPGEYYKNDLPVETGDGAGFYNASDSLPNNYPNIANLPVERGYISHYGGAQFMATEFVYLLLKDGDFHYVMDVSSWNRKDDLVWAGFWDTVNGSLSHVSLFGHSTAGFEYASDPVPEPASIAMWLTLAVGGAFVARRKSKKAVC